MSAPVPPEDVRAVYRDGREVPLELIYTGDDADGMHIWTPTASLPEPPARLTVVTLPGHTRIVLDVDEGEVSS